MSEPAKDNPKASKRSKRRAAMEPLGWDEIVSQPGMGGYLSFLNGPVPLPHLQGPAAVPFPDPGVISAPRAEPAHVIAPNPEPPSTSEPTPAPGVVPAPRVVPARQPASDTAPAAIPDHKSFSIPEVVLDPGVLSDPGPVSDPTVEIAPGATVINDLGFVCASPEVVSTPPSAPTPGHASSTSPDPEVVSIPAIPAGRLRIRRCAATFDGHSLGEEVLYQALWKAAHPESAETRTIVIGWRGMSQLCRMTPKNCKINTQRLIRKLALEVLSPYNTPESIGTTYRVYSDPAILQRRRKAGLEWVVRSRGVEFVNPATGVSILPICAPTHQSGPSPL